VSQILFPTFTKFSRIFSQFLAIYFELFSSGVNFNSENADEWVPPVSRRCPRRACLSAAVLHRTAPDWLPWVAVSECARRLKSRSDSAVQTTAARTHRPPRRPTPLPECADPRRCSNVPLCLAIPTTAVRSRHRPIRAVAAVPEAVDAAVYTAVCR
jgi:hypothetical protein